MRWLHRDWKPWAEKQGIHLLRDDFRYIEAGIGRLPVDMQKKAARMYVQVWLKASDQNKGRFAANQYLLDLTHIYGD